MIDSLLDHLERARQSNARSDLGLADKEYGVLTLHRPANVDDTDTFLRIIDALEEVARRLPIVFPAHPRTRKMIAELGLSERVEEIKGLLVIDPVGYLDFLQLLSGARLVLTDSGGIQEETTVLGIPCITLRQNTERPITVEMGTNTIAGTNSAEIVKAALIAIEGRPDKSAPNVPPFWDGHAADRILDALAARS
jgi:UDP-N-acetylglucosamine 2-epimerase (non-hydrolysing)